MYYYYSNDNFTNHCQIYDRPYYPQDDKVIFVVVLRLTCRYKLPHRRFLHIFHEIFNFQLYDTS